MITKHQPRKINPHYQIFDSLLLGKGSTGNVFEGRQLPTGRRVAIKVIELAKIDNDVTRYLLNCEIAALSSLGKSPNNPHRNIVQLLDTIRHQNHIYLITELLQGGTLMEYLHRYPNGLPLQTAQPIFRQLLQAYRYIRSKGVIHRDLKPSNILFRHKPENNKEVAVIDFGYCEVTEVQNKPKAYYNVGSPKYMSPEAYQSNLYSEKSDIWALGVIFYEMLTGRTCDHGMDMKEYLNVVEKKGITFHKPVSQFHRFLVSNMLQFDHHARFDCLQLTRTLKQHDTVVNRPNSSPAKENIDQRPQSTVNLPLFNLPPTRNHPIFRSMMVGQPKLEGHHQRVNFAVNQIRTPPNIVHKKQENTFDRKMVNFGSRSPFALNQLHLPPQGLEMLGLKPNTIHLEYKSQNSSCQIQQNVFNLSQHTAQFHPPCKQNQPSLNYTQIIKPNLPPRHSDHLARPPPQKLNFNISLPLQPAKRDATPHPNNLIHNRDRISTVPLHLQKYNDHPNSIIGKTSHKQLNTRQVFYSLDKIPLPLQTQPNWVERNITPTPKSLQIEIKKQGPVKHRKPGLSTPIRAEFSHLPSRSQRPQTSKACPVL